MAFPNYLPIILHTSNINPVGICIRCVNKILTDFHERKGLLHSTTGTLRSFNLESYHPTFITHLQGYQFYSRPRFIPVCRLVGQHRGSGNTLHICKLQFGSEDGTVESQTK